MQEVLLGSDPQAAIDPDGDSDDDDILASTTANPAEAAALARESLINQIRRFADLQAKDAGPDNNSCTGIVLADEGLVFPYAYARSSECCVTDCAEDISSDLQYGISTGMVP